MVIKFSSLCMKLTILFFWIAVVCLFLFVPSKLSILSLSKQDVLNIYCWSDVIDPTVVKEFEQATGIKVNISYYEQNYELFSKLELTKGKGYDLILATDFAVDFLRKKKLLKELDITKVTFLPSVKEELLNKPFDPHNKFSIPYIWDMYVIGYNKKWFNQKVPLTFDILFNPAFMPQHIAMIDEANEAFSFASEYLLRGPFSSYKEQDWNKIKQLLLRQKQFVEAYTDLRAGDLLLSGSVCAALSQAAHIYKAKKLSSAIEIFIPQPRSFLIIDSFVMPLSSKKDEHVYQFLNFIFTKEILKNVSDKYLYLPVRKDLLQEMDLDYLGGFDNLITHAQKARSFVALACQEEVSRLWMEIKAY